MPQTALTGRKYEPDHRKNVASGDDTSGLMEIEHAKDAFVLYGNDL